MRYSAGHKEETRRQIVEKAAALFLSRGEAVSIPAMMQALSLTHGGFYRHFVSKDQLFDEAFRWSAADAGRRLEGLGRRRAALVAIIDAYLSESHCEGVSDGCPLAAMGSEVARLRTRRRDSCARGLSGYVRTLAPHVPGATAAQRRERAALVLSSMAGTLIMARTMTDKRERRRFLRAARAYHTFAALA